MVCILSSPSDRSKGVLSITTPELRKLFAASSHCHPLIRELNKKYLIGLHLNWHLPSYQHIDFIDFVFAVEDDLGANAHEFSHLCINLDACNFPPVYFSSHLSIPQRTWDLLWFGRPVSFKQPKVFLQAIKQLEIVSRGIRILMVAPVPPKGNHSEDACFYSIYEDYMTMFSNEERQNFLLLSPTGAELPYSMQTIAWYFNNAKAFVHTSQTERRCRTMSYALKAGCHCIGTPSTLSIVPDKYKSFPFVTTYQSSSELLDGINNFLEYANSDYGKHTNKAARLLGRSMSSRVSLTDLNRRLSIVTGQEFTPIINDSNLDWRLGRHLSMSVEKNCIRADPHKFLEFLINCHHQTISRIALSDDPELQISKLL